ncbi:MAG: two-component regulator propeller domain-containing protein [Terriglobia bacterium]
MRNVSKRTLGAAIATGGLAVLAFMGFAFWRAAGTLRQVSVNLAKENEIHFKVTRLDKKTPTEFEWISSPAVFLQATPFHDHLYIAGPAGLLEYDPRGSLLNEYAVGRELPASALVAIARGTLADAREPELIMATAQDGLLAFDGRGFRQIFPQDPDARGITSILPLASGHLLLGTKKRGVLLYDGKRITALHPTLKNLYVTSLAGTESDLWVGTLNGGVLRWHGGATDSFGEEQGLPDRQVESIAVAGDKTYVGTVLGVAEFDRGRFARVLAPGVFATALLPRQGQLFVGSEDQGVIVIPLEERRLSSSPGGAPELTEVRQLFDSGEDVYALTRGGLYRMGAHGFGWQQVLQPRGAVLSDRNISALAADAQGRLWVGYFDRGLDLIEPTRERALHVENEHVFCVNRILPDGKTGTVDVATANGLVRFDAAGNPQQVLTRADGLIADHVTDVVPYQGGLALATPAGLTFLDASGARSMYAFHGLVNNHVYALGVSGDELMAGTLGGLSQLAKGDVQANYTTASSGLRHNWITAVVPVGSEWMVGTYGAGILGLDHQGQFHPFEIATGHFEVNPNAMLVTERHVFAGTLGSGLYVFDRPSERWFTIEAGLPSSNVTAFAASNGYLYVGTDNGLVRIPEQKLHP